MLLSLIFTVLLARFRRCYFPAAAFSITTFHTFHKRTRASDGVRVRAQIVPRAELLCYILPYSRDPAVAFPKLSGAPRALRFFLRIWKLVRVGQRFNTFNRENKRERPPLLATLATRRALDVVGCMWPSKRYALATHGARARIATERVPTS